MGLETASFLSDLDAANPPGTDLRSQGDNHLRLLKSVLQATFPSQGAEIGKVVDIGAAPITIDPGADNNKVFALVGNTVVQTLPAGAGLPDGFTAWFVNYGYTFTIMAAGVDQIAVHGADVTEEMVVTYDDGVLLYNGDWCRMTWTNGYWYAFQHCRPRVTSVNGMQGDVTIDAAEITAIVGGAPVVDPDFTGTNQSLSQNGYQKLPGGLIMQWGRVAVSGSDNTATFTFPIPFPNAVFVVTTAPEGPGEGGGDNDYWGFDTLTTSSVRIHNMYDAGQTAHIFAIGY